MLRFGWIGWIERGIPCSSKILAVAERNALFAGIGDLFLALTLMEPIWSLYGKNNLLKLLAQFPKFTKNQVFQSKCCLIGPI